MSRLKLSGPDGYINESLYIKFHDNISFLYISWTPFWFIKTVLKNHIYHSDVVMWYHDYQIGVTYSQLIHLLILNISVYGYIVFY